MRSLSRARTSRIVRRAISVALVAGVVSGVALTGSAGAAKGTTATAGVPSWIPSSVSKYYPGYQYFSTLIRNPYKSYKAPKGPWTFCYNSTYLGNAFQEGVVSELQKLVGEMKKAGLATGSLTVTNSNNNPTLELSQLNTLIQKGCKVIFGFPASATALCSAIATAAKHNLLYVSVESPVSCPDAINVTWNGYWAEKVGADAVLKAMNYQGNLVVTQGIPGVAIGDAETFAVQNALKGHPGVTVLGNVAGMWTPSVAATAMTQFLATHPQTVNGIIDAGAEDVATEQALLNAGRPAALVNSITGECSILALWKQHPEAMTLGLNQDPGAAAYESFYVAERMLAGQKPVANVLFYPVPTITKANFGKWYKPSMTLQSGCIPPSPGGRAVADAYFNAFFTGGSPLKVAVKP